MTAPVNTALPTITAEGRAMTGTDGVYTGTAPISKVYQWMAAITSLGVPVGEAGTWVGLAIDGETGTDYTPALDVNGESFFRDENASNVDGDSGWISSETYIAETVLYDYYFTRRDVHHLASAA